MFKKGEINNSAGRPQGAQNKKTVEHLKRSARLRAMIEADPRFPEMVSGLTLKEMATLYTDLLEYEEPKQSRVTHTDNEGGPLVITVRHSVQPPPMLTTQPVVIEDADFSVIEPSLPGAKPF